jgi:hypothetical protein
MASQKLYLGCPPLMIASEETNETGLSSTLHRANADALVSLKGSPCAIEDDRIRTKRFMVGVIIYGVHGLVNFLPNWERAKDHTTEVQGQNCTFCLQRMYLKQVSHTIQHKMKLNIQQRICKKYMSNEMQLKQKEEEKLFCFSCQHKAQVEGK